MCPISRLNMWKELELQQRKLELDDDERQKRLEMEQAERKQRMDMEHAEMKLFLELLKKHLNS